MSLTLALIMSAQYGIPYTRFLMDEISQRATLGRNNIVIISADKTLRHLDQSVEVSSVYFNKIKI